MKTEEEIRLDLSKAIESQNEADYNADDEYWEGHLSGWIAALDWVLDSKYEA